MRPGTSLEPPLGTLLARVLLVAFAAVHVVLVLGPGPTAPDVTAVALLAIVGAAAIVVLTPGRLLPRGRTVLVVVLVLVGVALVVPWLPGRGWPGYAAWPLGAGTFVAVGITLRGRIGAAWLLLVSMAALCVLWAVQSAQNPLAGLGLVDRHAGIVLIGTLFAIGLGRSARAHDALLEVRRTELLERGLAEAELAMRREAVERVLAEAGPTLERIAAGDAFDDAERTRIAAIEGRLRDEMTLGSMHSADLDRALRSARLRGVDVVMLTEPAVANVTPQQRTRAADWLVARLDRAQGAEFVGRVLFRGSGLRVSAAVDEQIEERLIGDLDD